MTAAPEGPTVAPDPIGPYVRWAQVLFAILAIVSVIGLVLLALGSAMVLDFLGVAGGAFGLLAVGTIVTLVVLVVLVSGLSSRRAWAIHAIAPLCYLLLVVGLIRVAVALSRGEILFPLEAIGAALVLTRPHGPALMPPATDADRCTTWLVVIALTATYVLPYLTPLVVR
jgi:hypothetical protein